MAMSVNYDIGKNTVYVKTGPLFKGQELVDLVDLWNTHFAGKVIMANINLVLDIKSVTDIQKWNPYTWDRESDPAWKDRCYHYFKEWIRSKGDGKIVIVCDHSKGNSKSLCDIFLKPDGVFYMTEDADAFIETGHGIDRGYESH